MDDQPALVAAQIKDDPIVAYEVDGATKLPLYFGGICPTRLRCNGHLGTDWTLSMWVTRPELLQRPTGDHLHHKIVSCHQSGDNLGQQRYQRKCDLATARIGDAGQFSYRGISVGRRRAIAVNRIMPP